ncbi:hypothetical protein MKW98_018535 [Papaver atlanticum]|uniref:FBD domain-containing protein n=1 Tax=Papaver atlanticum TaxID=357466 RepID=A0AAD4XU04_9MAGN|nr:hypothetical protein MKW98_018535 [Papaver atlanticum]
MVLKKEKQPEGSSIMVREEDRISKLPNPLLHHILFFLPFKNIVCTCVLAKRWRFVWSSVPNIEIGHWCSPDATARKLYMETIHFMDFMDRLFRFRDMSNIGKFSLSCNKHCDEDRVHSWLSAVVRHNVVEFSLLSKDERDSSMIPLLLFTCETLTMLKIEMPIYVDVPTNVHLPKLKVLQLINIRFTAGPLIEKLCSNCLVLEELEINNCTIEDIMEISISSHTLKRMFIDVPLCHQIDIDAPSLEVFQHKGTLAEVYDLFSFPSLIDANISLSDINDWMNGDHNIATNLLGHLFNVKRLVAGSCFLGALSCADDNAFGELPSFHNLTCLEVVWSSPDPIGSALMRLLQISLKLETLVFSHGIDARLCGEDNGWKLTTVPECLLSHLRVLEFHQFCGDQREIGAVKLFSENAKVLQSLIIYTSSALSRDLSSKLQVEEQLQMLPRASSNCKLTVQ